MQIALVAGEASGDLLAAHLIKSIKTHVPDARFVGIGGPRMQAEGFEAWWPQEKLAVRGYIEVLRHYREIVGIRRKLARRLLDDPPSVFIGVDAPDFNLCLERKLRSGGITSIHYVSPSIWAWRAGRLKNIAVSVSHMLCLFPFEPALYRDAGLPATFVGHPLADVIPIESRKETVREKLDIASGAQVVALLPGSRQSELQFMAECFLRAALLIHARNPKVLFLVPLATKETRALFDTMRWKMNAQELPMRLMFGHAQDALSAADCALIASGTATLEAALCKTPHVIAYKMSHWSWQIMRRMRLQPWVGLPNVLAGEFLVPELLQDEATPEKLADAVLALLTDKPRRQHMIERFAAIHEQLRQGASERAAEAILPYLKPVVKA